MQFGPSVLRAKPPFYSGSHRVAPGFIGADGRPQSTGVGVVPQRHARGARRTQSLACLGVWRNSGRFAMRLASVGEEIS